MSRGPVRAKFPEQLVCRIGDDDLRLREQAPVRGVAFGMIPMKVRVDDVAHWLG